MKEKECRALYREAFSDPDDTFENQLFATCFSYCRTYNVGGRTVSMLFALPCRIAKGKDSFEARYIYAVATKQAYRRKGYAAALLQVLQQEEKPLLLIPATESLRCYYYRFGFRDCQAATYSINGYRVIPTGGFASLAKNEMAEYKACYIAQFWSKSEPLPTPLYFPYGMK